MEFLASSEVLIGNRALLVFMHGFLCVCFVGMVFGRAVISLDSLHGQIWQR